MNSLGSRKVVLVSNRLPIHFEETIDGCKIQSAAGGLVTALSPLMKESKGVWVGWPGCNEKVAIDNQITEYNRQSEFRLFPIRLTDDQIEQYYRGFANQSIWPLFHDMLGHAHFETPRWNTYCHVNHIFARETANLIKPGCFTWIHDYQLLLMGAELRKLGVTEELTFFLHIPFPSRDLFKRFPWKVELLESMLQYDHIGFQTQTDHRNFLQCLQAFLSRAQINENEHEAIVEFGERKITVGRYPISIDFKSFDTEARTDEITLAAKNLQSNAQAKVLALGLDRLDYTKGIAERFLSFERALEKYPDLRGELSLIQIVIPSRLKVPDYRDLKNELDNLAGRINGRFSHYGWAPIHYMFRSLDRQELLAHYRACKIACVTPLRDGMNLVAKEFCAATTDCNGVLILSEFAGAAAQLSRGAVLVNPYDLEDTADKIYLACRMGLEERVKRMKVMRTEIKRNDVHQWVGWFLGQPQYSPLVTTII